MRNIRSRLSKLEQQAQPIAHIWETRMVKITQRRFVREVAAGTRKPEAATQEAALAELRSYQAHGGSLAEAMEAAIRRGKAGRKSRRVAMSRNQQKRVAALWNAWGPKQH